MDAESFAGFAIFLSSFVIDKYGYWMEAGNEKFLSELKDWLGNRGFVNDRGWSVKNEGMGFYSFSKKEFRFEIRTDWNIKGSYCDELLVQFIDCSKEIYFDGPYIGYMGQRVLHSFNKPIGYELFDSLCNHYTV